VRSQPDTSAGFSHFIAAPLTIFRTAKRAREVHDFEAGIPKEQQRCRRTDQLVVRMRGKLQNDGHESA
jgi:hypothetical protein